MPKKILHFCDVIQKNRGLVWAWGCRCVFFVESKKKVTLNGEKATKNHNFKYVDWELSLTSCKANKGVI